jgi:uncharacterized protein YbaR (Trm112 family)
MDMICCPKCNTSVPFDYAKDKQFCSSCGNLLQNQSIPQGTPEPVPVNQGQESIGCISALGALCMLVALLIFLVTIAFLEGADNIGPPISFSLKLGVCGLLIYGFGVLVHAMKK